MAQKILIDAGPHLIALGMPLDELLSSSRCAGGLQFSFFNLGRLLPSISLGAFTCRRRVRIHHQLKDLVFVARSPSRKTGSRAQRFV